MEVYKYILLLVCCKVLCTTAIFNMRCRGLNENCFCIPIMDGYEFQCPNETAPKVVVTVQPKSININCVDATNWMNQDVGIIETDNINHIAILNCWFATNNFAQTMKNFGINSSEVLTVDISVGFGNVTLTADYFKNLRNLKKLSLHDSSLNYEDAFKLLDNLIELSLSNNNMPLTGDMFIHLEKLNILQLTNNKISYLPTHLFQNLRELKILHLWSNTLRAINSNTFKNLQNLELLELSRNQLKHLLVDTFYDLKNLKKINLSMNKLRYLPEGLFSKNLLLEFTSISRNPNLTYLPDNLFSNLTKLETILLDNCKLIHIPPNLFNGSINLKKIALQRNEIEVIPESLFNNLVELRNLDLSYNKIKDLSNEVFKSLSQLKILNLERNLLENLKEGYFKSLQQLELLNLKNNKIRFIDDRSFQSILSLKKIVLANNYLNMSMGNIFSYNNKLENIDLSNNNITDMDNYFVLKVGLRELDLSYNQISYVEFSNLMTVSFPIKINLRHNNISTVNFDYADIIARTQGYVYHNPSNSLDRKVYLGGNPINCDCNLYNFSRYFDHSIDPAVATVVKIIPENLKCASPNEFIDYPVSRIKPSMLMCSLQQIEIEADCPGKCFCEYRPYDQSLIVNCNKANLTAVPQLNISTTNLFNQMEVYLQNNFLTSGPKENMGYENVSKLFLSYNNINEVTWVPPNIKVLQLNNNNIQQLNDKVLTMLNASSVTNITLGNNPINCDCSVEKLRTFVLSHLVSRKVHLDMVNITCKNNEKFLTFNNEYCPPYKDILIGFSIPLSLIMVGTAIFIMIWLKGKGQSFKHKVIKN